MTHYIQLAHHGTKTQFGNLIGSFEGEIFNTSQLQDIFKITGSLPLSNSTNIILPLFNVLGSSIIQHLDGFYSGIIHNQITKQTFILTDHIGTKPLFIIRHANYIKLSDQLKHIDSYQDFESAPKGFSELRDQKIILQEKHKILHTSKTELKQVIENAVSKPISNKKNIGVFLSGGLDSSIIASIISKYRKDVTYYVLGNNDDYNYAKILARKLNIESRVREVRLPHPSEMSELIKSVVYHTESYNPSIVSNGLSTFVLAREAQKDGLSTIVVGEGADELFCGYKISKNIHQWFNERSELIENLHFTECRRLYTISKAFGIDIHCPFLDKEVFAIANDCTETDLIANSQGKQILRKIFAGDLPNEILARDKMSFDVGSGIRKMVVEHLTQHNSNEKDSLKKIFQSHFPKTLLEHPYFHSYPTFDSIIARRGASHKEVELQKKIEKLLFEEFKTIPFHNLFMLNNINIKASSFGGTCSDKVLHFQQTLALNGIASNLHSAYINNIECHRMLSVMVGDRKYFIDPGSGWLNPKLIPAFRPIEYSMWGITFKTELLNKHLFLYKKTTSCSFKLMIKIPLVSKPEKEILVDIENRFKNKIIYPFFEEIRFSQATDKSFYFIKGTKLRIYQENRVTEHTLSKEQIQLLFKNTFNFNPQNTLL